AEHELGNAEHELGDAEHELGDAELERQWIEFYNELNPSPEDEAWAQAALDRLYSRQRGSDSNQLAA
ncbi:MAG: hypothetical protein ACRDPW_00035, partial [Mycobacteriales bacterium]